MSMPIQHYLHKMAVAVFDPWTMSPLAVGHYLSSYSISILSQVLVLLTSYFRISTLRTYCLSAFLS